MLAFIGLAGCTYRGGVGEPLQRKFSWFSYVAGDDIREACRPGSPTQYRMVYNALWLEQVRAYDLRRIGQDSGANLWVQIFGGEAPLGRLSPWDVQGPWRGETAQTRLSEDQYLTLIRAVEASGFGQPTLEGMRLPSSSFYWVVAACAGGRFHFNAWKHPEDRWAQLTFDRALFDLDRSGVRVNPARPIDAAQEYRRAEDRGDAFELRVGRDGLTGRLPPI